MSYFLISAGRVAMETVQYHSAIPLNALRLSHHPVWRGNPVYTLRKAVDIWTHAIFLILLLCRRADTQRCDVSMPPTCRALKSPGSASEGGGWRPCCCVGAVGALWLSCAAGLCCTEGRVTLTNQTRLLLSLLLLDLICSILKNTLWSNLWATNRSCAHASSYPVKNM